MQSPGNPPRAFVAYCDKITNVLATKVTIGQAFSVQSNPPPQTEYIAIWDTGATNTVITPQVVSDCNLKAIGMIRVNHAGGHADHPVYLISIMLPNKVGLSEVRVTGCEEIGDAQVLVGMDIMNAGDFAVTNKDGKTVFSFRMPSISVIDFVKQAALTSSLNITEAPKGNRAERRRAQKQNYQKP